MGKEKTNRIPLPKPIVLVGLMGAGKSSIGRRLADYLGVSFVDSDTEIETAANRTIPEIFAEFGESYFREGEKKVIARLLSEEPGVIATGGGAFINDETRRLILDQAISIWICADLDTLWDRVRGRSGRPLLQNDDPKGVLQELMNSRYPVYALAELSVESTLGAPHEDVIDKILEALVGAGYLKGLGDVG